ncbi:MAG: hypothetical protein ABIJ74_04100 [archaeon]
MTGKLKFSEGGITAFDEPFCLLDLYSLKKMTDDAIEGGPREISRLYFYGWTYGYRTTKNMVRILNLRQFEERYKVSMDIIGLLGFGDYKTLSFKRADHAKFDVLGNPFALQYHPFNKFVCHFIRGMEAGGGTLVHEVLINNLEFECAAINGKKCHHENLNQANINGLDKKFVSEQLDLDYLKKRQRELVLDLGDDPAKLGFD